MSSLSITAISDFMIFGGAVMMSALVATSAQMVTLASTLEAPPPAAAAGAPFCGAAQGFRGGARLALQLVGDLFGVRIPQVAHLGVAAPSAGACRG